MQRNEDIGLFTKPSSLGLNKIRPFDQALTV